MNLPELGIFSVRPEIVNCNIDLFRAWFRQLKEWIFMSWHVLLKRRCGLPNRWTIEAASLLRVWSFFGRSLIGI